MGSSIEIACSFCYEDDRKGTHYELFLGSGMMCFCKEQLREFYDITNNRISNESPIEDEEINKIILSNLKNGFSFTEHLGYIPYYCETCKKLLSLFYFQMELKGNYYVPKYSCYKCKNVLEPLNIVWEDQENNREEDALENIEIKYTMNIKKDDTIKIVFENKEKKLVCKYCNNEKFICLGNSIEWD